MNVGMYILLGCVFVAGFILGGVIIYAYNAKRWHQEDLDLILARLTRVDGNVMKIHSNSKLAATRFGQFASMFEQSLSDMQEKTNITVRLIKDQNAALVAHYETVDELKATSSALSEQVGEVGLNTERVLERVKLL